SSSVTSSNQDGPSSSTPLPGGGVGLENREKANHDRSRSGIRAIMIQRVKSRPADRRGSEADIAFSLVGKVADGLSSHPCQEPTRLAVPWRGGTFPPLRGDAVFGEPVHTRRERKWTKAF